MCHPQWYQKVILQYYLSIMIVLLYDHRLLVFIIEYEFNHLILFIKLNSSQFNHLILF